MLPRARCPDNKPGCPRSCSATGSAPGQIVGSPEGRRDGSSGSTGQGHPGGAGVFEREGADGRLRATRSAIGASGTVVAVARAGRNGLSRGIAPAQRAGGGPDVLPRRRIRPGSRFVETGGVIEVAADQTLLVTFDRRSHNPVLREAALDRDGSTIPWLGGHRLQFRDK